MAVSRFGILYKLGIPCLILLVFALATSFSSCSKKEEEQKPVDEVLIQIGDSVLTRNMVTRLIPVGLSPTDSVRMFDAIVEAWVDRNMLVNLAGSRLPDVEKIEHMVEEYREQLLANEYRRLMANDNAEGITPDLIQTYYDEHPDLFTLEAPLLKGIYLKISEDAPQLGEVRNWMKRAESADIDNIENYGLSSAMEYDYFGDTWVDWTTVSDHIPYRFGDADVFVSGNKFFEINTDGSVYMLRIFEYLKSGSEMPLEFAEAGIRERLLEQKRNDYDRKLLGSLYANGIKSKKIVPGSYIPIKYRPE
ncbi:MAG: hypothetical protein NC217_05665 [Muribaculaceae bacterium]|nr:hypothetical protein [Muribaculaceae bacterium]